MIKITTMLRCKRLRVRWRSGMYGPYSAESVLRTRIATTDLWTSRGRPWLGKVFHNWPNDAVWNNKGGRESRSEREPRRSSSTASRTYPIIQEVWPPPIQDHRFVAGVSETVRKQLLTFFKRFGLNIKEFLRLALGVLFDCTWWSAQSQLCLISD